MVKKSKKRKRLKLPEAVTEELVHPQGVLKKRTKERERGRKKENKNKNETSVKNLIYETVQEVRR